MFICHSSNCSTAFNLNKKYCITVMRITIENDIYKLKNKLSRCVAVKFKCEGLNVLNYQDDNVTMQK